MNLKENIAIYQKKYGQEPLNKFKNYRTLRVLGRVYDAPVLKALTIRRLMFKKLFSKKSSPEYIVLNLNARLQPLHRGDIYEDPLDKKVRELSIGSVCGGGTLQTETGEIESCDIEFEVGSSSEEVVNSLIEIVSALGVPKGSSLKVEKSGRKIDLGQKEGLALYLNGTELPNEVYEKSDINDLVEKIHDIVNSFASLESHWEGPSETALYYYGTSFDEINNAINGLLQTYPLCEKCRVVQIA